MDADIGAIGTRQIAAIAIVVIAGTAALALGGNRCSSARADERADRSTAVSADCAADDRAADAANDGPANGILRRSLMDRHRHRNRQTRRKSETSKHSSSSNVVRKSYRPGRREASGNCVALG